MTWFNFGSGDLKEGDSLPSVWLVDHRNEILDPHEFKGEWQVYYFYPKDNTPGCTKEGQEFSRLAPEFERNGIRIFGVSMDTPETHRSFREKKNLYHPLISDPQGEFAKRFGIRIMLGMCSRDTVIIDPELRVDKIFRGVSPSNSPQEVLDYVLKNKETAKEADS